MENQRSLKKQQRALLRIKELFEIKTISLQMQIIDAINTIL